MPEELTQAIGQEPSDGALGSEQALDAVLTDDATGGATGEDQAPVGEAPADGAAFDPNNLPPDLQTQYKQMQGDYTRKTQALAEERRNFEQEQANLAWARQIQEAAQRDPAEARRLLAAMADYVAPATNPDPNAQANPLTAVEWEYESEGTQALARVMDSVAGNLMQRLQAIEAQLNPIVHETYQQKQQGELGSLKSEFGELITPEIEQSLLRDASTTGRPLRDVFVLNHIDAIREADRQSAYKNIQHKKATNPPITGGVKTVPNVEVNSAEDAFALAMKQLGYR